jgi:hypothetical protein
VTLSETGYVLGRSPSTLNKAVDSGVIRAKQRRVGKSVQRLLGPPELRYLRLDLRLAMDQRAALTGVTAERVLREIAAIAFFDLRKAFNPDGTLKLISDVDD